MIAPLRNTPTEQKPWEGSCKVKPWEYKICAVVPVLDTVIPLKIVVELLRHQTEKPYIVVVDTGSMPDKLLQIEAMRADDLEVHSIRLNGVLHPSDFPAIAMDLAFSLCRSPYMFCTHADCFIKRQDLLADMLVMCEECKAVGYEITPRKHEDWQGMLGHTCTMLDMQTMDICGAGWSLRRLATLFDIEDHKPNPMRPNWPDTELLLNYMLRNAGIEACIMGTEENFQRNVNEDFDHCRTLTGGLLYSPEYYHKAKRWVDDAMRQAKDRIADWEQTS